MWTVELAFVPERVILPEPDVRAAAAAISALRLEAAERGLPPDVVDLHLPVATVESSEIVTLSQENVAFLDSAVGTGPNINALNGLGVLAWRIGGGQAEAVVLGEPIHLPTPRVVGVRLIGALPPGVAGADVIGGLPSMRGAFLEFHGPGADALAVADRMAIAAAVAERGAVSGLFPIDERTLDYLYTKGFPASHVELTAAYCRAQGLWDVQADYAELLTLDLSAVEPSDGEAVTSGRSRPEIIVPELHPARRPRDVKDAQILLVLDDDAVPDLERLRNERKAHPLGDVPLALVTGRDYGGAEAANDWAGRGTRQLGIRVVLSSGDFLGTHRADLISAGVLPLQIKVELHGDETLTITGVADVQPGQLLTVEVSGRGGRRRLKLQALVRLDNRQELEWFRHGGALPYILDRLLEAPQ